MAKSAGSPSADLDLLALLGRWDLDRRVSDRLAGLAGRMRGTLTISDDLFPLGSPASPDLQVTDLRVTAGRSASLRSGEAGPGLEGAGLGEGSALRWEEEGILDVGGNRLHAHRNLALRVVDGEWWMTFEDGGLFHPWQLGEWVEHPCGADWYRGRLQLDPEARQMRILWDVTGPSKRQRIFTRYRQSESLDSPPPGYRRR
jgi:Family of unknown function (DUF6314)